MKSKLHSKYSSVAIVILFVITGLLVAACSGMGQPKTYTIGVVNISAGLETDLLPSFKENMAGFGYKEGQNVTYIYKGVPDKVEKLDALAQELVQADVDLILALTSPAALAAKRATTDNPIPVVFVPVNDPVASGIVASLRNPGGNITGITFGVQEPRRFEWLIQVAPDIKKVYIPYTPEDQSAVISLAKVREAAQKLGGELITREVHTAEEIPASVENIPEEADAIFILPDSLIGHRTADFAETAIQRKLPTSGPNPVSVTDSGFLTSYSADPTGYGKQAARLVDQILRGVKPADLPVEMAEFILAINLKTAKAIGLDIPDSILRQADIIVR